MHYDIKEQFFLNHGWAHCWCDPNIFKNFRIKEVVKGSFVKPKIINPIPYVTVSQQRRRENSLSDGIPDCWAEYLSHYLRICQNYESMHKEDVDIVPQLRKNYRLYLGQGIPNPWVPCIDDLKTFSHLNLETPKKHSCRLSRCKKINLKNEHCVCCSRKYLFKCPDSCDSNSSSSVKNCRCNYAPGIDCSEKHKKLLLNTKKGNAKFRKKKAIKQASESGPASLTESSCVADDEGENFNGKNESNDYKNKFLKEQFKQCSCPYIKNYLMKKPLLKNDKDNGGSKSPTLVSKLIQAEFQPLKKSKSVQTDELKLQPNTKCFWCNVFQYNSPWSTCYKQGNPAGPYEVGCPSVCLAPSYFFPARCPQNPALFCPYSFSNHFMTYKPNKEKSPGLKKPRYKKKQLEENESQDDYNAQFRFKPKQLKANEASERNTKWDNAEEELLKPNYSIYSCPKLSKTFDHMKYLTDDKLNYYLQREDNSPLTQNKKLIHQSLFSGFQTKNFDKGNTTFYNPARIQLERFKSFSHSSPEYLKSSLNENLMSPRERSG